MSDQYADSSNLSARVSLHRDFSTNTHDLYAWEFDLAVAAVGGTARVLEVGCGTGALWKKNVERIPDDWTITLTDASDGMLEDAIQSLGGYGETFSWQTADVENLPFADGAFDAVFAHFMLYHAEDVSAAVHELARILASDGVLLAATNGAGHMRELRELAKGVAPEFACNPEYQAFGLENGESILEAGFGDIQLIERPDSLHVTKHGPLVDYLVSVEGDATREQELRAAVDEYWEAGSAFQITKRSGVFVARK